MNWIEVTVKTTGDGIEPVSGIIILHGVTGYTVMDSKDFCDFLADNRICWDYIEDSLLELKNCETTVTFYLENSPEGQKVLDDIKADIALLKKNDNAQKFGALSIDSSLIENEDWKNNWKKYFKPLNVGRNLLIKPSWESSDGSETKTVIEIDPSSSFGTGSHATTQLCLAAIESCFEGGPAAPRMILDVGCGSGILGVAACKLGAEHVTAIDIEENSAKVAKENFVLNKIPDKKYRILIGNILSDSSLLSKISDRKYDLIAANIVADVLKEMAPILLNLLADGGKVVISGIISERTDEVRKTFESCGFKIKDIAEKDGWSAIILSV